MALVTRSSIHTMHLHRIFILTISSENAHDLSITHKVQFIKRVNLRLRTLNISFFVQKFE